MTLQNRVTPFGDIVAVPMRSVFTGNRGIIHDPATKTLLRRRWTSRAWIVCSCQYKGVRREVMATQSWTELFFLDEATALAAGHRPCFLCRRDAAKRFSAAWAKGNGGALPGAGEIDAALHEERLAGKRKRLHPLAGSPQGLPDGAMFAAGDRAYLVAGGQLLLWTPDGYRPMQTLPMFDGMLTPPSTLRALAGGYRPVLHGSATG